MTRRTIKRDTNSGLGGTKCMKNISKQSTSQPQKFLQLAVIHHFFQFSEVLSFSRRFRTALRQPAETSRSRRFWGFSRRVRDFKSDRYRSRSESIYAPLLPNGQGFFSPATQTHLKLSLLLLDTLPLTLLLDSKNPLKD